MARGEIEGTRPVWEEWILAESKRRYDYDQPTACPKIINLSNIPP